VRRGGQISFLDPTVVLPVMAAARTHLGLGATLSTSFHTAYHLARWLGSLDVMSKGRVAWNVVTSATDLEAQNAGLDELPPRELRYDRADEVLEACFALWNGWDEGAFVLDKQAGVFADPAKVHYANYEGRWIKTRGPLSIPRSPQGHPVIMQAGQFRSGPRVRRALGRGDLHHPARPGRDAGILSGYQSRAWRRSDAPGRMRDPAGDLGRAGRDRVDRARAGRLSGQPDRSGTESGAASSNLGADLTKLKGVRSLADLQGNQGMKGTEDVLQQTMKAEGLTLRTGRGASATRGANWSARRRWSPIACRMFESGVCDGFVLAPTMFPGMFEQFCRSVVPELQRRGLFRTEYTGPHPAREPAGLRKSPLFNALSVHRRMSMVISPARPTRRTASTRAPWAWPAPLARAGGQVRRAPGSSRARRWSSRVGAAPIRTPNGPATAIPSKRRRAPRCCRTGR
jgi:alkanesulfonate monooxygenase SsuD/methylene tetrahydromethanopterin reductase-like flavin-dependent oxidoreductase (luciferase family)